MSQQGPYDPNQGYGGMPGQPGQPGAQPPNAGYGPPQPGYGAPQQPGYGQTYPEESQATTILIFGILSLVVCQLFGPVAWKMGNSELAAIDAGRRSPKDRQNANIGRILGIIGTVLLGIVLAIFLLYIVIAFIAIGASAAGA